MSKKFLGVFEPYLSSLYPIGVILLATDTYLKFKLDISFFASFKAPQQTSSSAFLSSVSNFFDLRAIFLRNIDYWFC